MTFSVAEVIVYGLLSAAIVAGVLYVGGRSWVQIAATCGGIVGAVIAFGVIAPRARPAPATGSTTAPDQRDAGVEAEPVAGLAEAEPVAHGERSGPRRHAAPKRGRRRG